jgi:hypothetical protein
MLRTTAIQLHKATHIHLFCLCEGKRWLKTTVQFNTAGGKLNVVQSNRTRVSMWQSCGLTPLSNQAHPAHSMSKSYALQPKFAYDTNGDRHGIAIGISQGKAMTSPVALNYRNHSATHTATYSTQTPLTTP